MLAGMTLDTRLKLFLTLAGIFISALLVGDLIGGKLGEAPLFDQVLTLTVGMIPFPITFLLTDLLNEFYGKRAARFVTVVGFAMAALTFVIIFVAVKLPWPALTEAPDWQGMRSASYDAVFAGSQRFL